MTTRSYDPVYHHRHYLVRKARGPAKLHDCVRCIENEITKPAAHWALIHGETGDDPWADYVPLCQSCHFTYDQVGERKRGVPHPPAWNAAISAGKKGKPTHRKTDDEKARISAALKGRRSPTTGMKMSEATRTIHREQSTRRPRDEKGRYR